MMSFKLALRNVKNSFRDYAVYFLTITFGVCIFYVFNSIESLQAMMIISRSQAQELKLLNDIMGFVSVFVSVIFGFLILYANRFLIKRRKKELGIYMTLGMKKGRISRILVIETVVVGIFSLAAGMLIGIFASQGLAVVTANMFEAKLTAYKFVVSFPAVLKAMLYFGIEFFLVILFNAYTIGRQKLITLIYAGRKNEKFKAPRLILSVFLFVIASLCLGIAYKMILDNGLYEINIEFWITIILGCVGTFLFFFSLSGFFLKLISQSKRIYLKNLNMFVLRQINSKINTTYVSMTMVCLMLFISICTFSAGMSISKLITAELQEVTPFDATCVINAEKFDFDVVEYLKEQGTDINIFAKEYAEISIYSYKGNTVRIIEVDIRPDFVKLSEYNASLKLQGKDPIAISEGEYAINSNMTNVNEYDWQKVLKDYMSSGTEIFLNGKSYRTNSNYLYRNTIQVAFGRYDMMTVIVPDSALESADVSYKILNINYMEDSEACEQFFEKAFYRNSIGTSREDVFIGGMTRKGILGATKTISTTISYLAIYIGVVFLITSAAVLAIAQLSEASDNIERYGLLRKIGVEGRMINNALFLQILVYFGVPLLLAGIHSLIGLMVVGNVVAEIGNYNILTDSIVMALIMVVVYGGYFAATYWGSKNIITRK